MTDPPALANLPEARRAQALQRFQLLRPTLEAGVPLADVARTQGVPLRTMQRWQQAYARDGLVALARHPRRDRGRRQVPELLVRLIEGLALRRPAPSVATIQRQVAAVAQEREWPVPSYSTVFAIVRQLDPGLVLLAQGGTKAYKEAFDLLYRHEANAPNEIWQADHTPLDLLVLDERGKPVRPWLSVILDDYSRAVAGYRLSPTAPSALQTALMLRQAMWRKGEAAWRICGIPAAFYTDHGSDFTSQHLEQVSADLKIRLIFSRQGEPRGRGKIERFFETVNQLFLSTQPGYAPPGMPKPPPGITLAQLEDRLHVFLIMDYLQRPHGETGMAPQARWEAGGFLPQLPESLEQLDLLLLTVAKPRQVQQDGIHFHGLRYIDLTLAAYVGEPVIIRYDPRDMAEIRVFHRDTFLCRAICQELAGETISLKEVVQARKGRLGHLRAGLSAREAVVEAFLAVHQGEQAPAQPPPLPEPSRPRLKRYFNE